MSTDWSVRQVAIPHSLEDVPRADPHLVARTIHGTTMGTTWSASFSCSRDVDLAAIRTGAESCLDRIVAEMSPWQETSAISRFNRSANDWQPLPASFARVLDSALTVAQETDGAYDPTIGPLVDLWGFGPAGTRASVPRAVDIDAARRRCGWRQVQFDAHLCRARQPGGVSLDLSSIAKGFAVDVLCRSLEEHGIASYLVEIGGELRGRGTKPNGQPWWVTIEPPLHPQGSSTRKSLDVVIALHGLAVATSGDYRSGFQSHGRWYSHIIDPRSGYPVGHALASVTVLHRECMLADAWSTALLVLGTDSGIRQAEERGLAALFVSRTDDRLTPYATSNFDTLLR